GGHGPRGDGAIAARQQAVAAYLAQSQAALRANLGNPALRRLQLGWLFSTSGEYAAQVAFNVWAYSAHGATGIGVMTVVQMACAALLSPFTSMAADRFPRAHVARVSDLVRAAALAASGLAVSRHSPEAVPYLLGAVHCVGTT